MALTDAARALLSQPNLIHLAVVDADGAPHVTPVWADVTSDGQVLVNTALGRKKDRYLGVGAPVAFDLTDPENPYSFVLVRGSVVERRTETADADINALAKKYLGVDEYPFRQPGEERVSILIDPVEVVGG